MKRKVALIVKSKSNVDFIIEYFSQNSIDVNYFRISKDTNPQELILDLEK
jgi:hypothetical protein